MPKQIHISHPVNPNNSIVVSAKTLNQNKRVIALEQQAKKNASRILHDAERERETFTLHGYQQGYQQAMIYALQQTVNYFSASEAMAKHWRDILIDEMREILFRAVDHPDTILVVLNEWLRELPAREAVLYLALPDYLSNEMRTQLTEQLAKNWPGTLQLDYHHEPRFVMRYADQIAEYSPEKYVETTTRLLQQKLNGLSQECREISIQSIKSLIEYCQTLIKTADSGADIVTDENMDAENDLAPPENSGN